MSADELLKTLQAAGIPINGMQILDPRDAKTWVLSGDLTDDQRARAVLLLHAMLVPAAPVGSEVSIPLRLFLLLITPSEYFRLVTQADTDAQVRYYLDLMRAGPAVDPAEPWFDALLGYGVTIKVWTQERAEAILAAVRPG